MLAIESFGLQRKMGQGPRQHQKLYLRTKEILDDNHLDCDEANELKKLLEKALENYS